MVTLPVRDPVPPPEPVSAVFMLRAIATAMVVAIRRTINRVRSRLGFGIRVDCSDRKKELRWIVIVTLGNRLWRTPWFLAIIKNTHVC